VSRNRGLRYADPLYALLIPHIEEICHASRYQIQSLC
jgi:hypothetical protein